MKYLFRFQAERKTSVTRKAAFTLIELLIVVAIIAILAAIAVPNFLEAQIRAKVSRVKSDLRTLSIGFESYRIDHNKYPACLDNPNDHDQRISVVLGALDSGYYTQITRVGTAKTAGRDFHTVTTPIAYLTTFFSDPFVKEGGGVLTYCARVALTGGHAFVLTSVGPDVDLFATTNGKVGCGTTSTNPLSTFVDPAMPARLGDIDEHLVGDYFDNKVQATVDAVNAMGGLKKALEDLSYDPTNGTTSDGDIYRSGPG